VAELLLLDPRSFATLPVVELAERAHVSKPTVVRFCRSVGYDGLADFKLKLAGSVSEGVPFVHRSVDEDDKAGDIVVKVIDNAVAAMLRYRNAAAGSAIERAIAALADAGRHSQQGRRIEFYGVGNSGIVAQDAQHKFFRLGVTAAAISDGHVQVMSATMLRTGDCAVIISNSGRSRDLLDVAEIARRKGATVIAITASGSLLAREVQGGNQHILLAADHPEDADRYSPMVSRLLHLLIIDILTTGVALRLGSAQLRPMLQEIKKNLRAKRYADSARSPGGGDP
jgi:RpiR family carbohydrate utilization transcriptional regulator